MDGRRAPRILSGVLAFAGLSSVSVGDLRRHNVGIAGGAVVQNTALLLALMFKRIVPSRMPRTAERSSDRRRVIA